MLSNQPAAEKHPKSTWLNGVVNRFEVYCRIPKVSNSPLSFRAHAACTAWLDSATANRRVGRSRRIAAITQPNPHQIAHFWSAMTCHRFGFSCADRLPMSFGVERLCPRRFLMSPTFLKGYLPTFHFPDVSSPRCLCPPFWFTALSPSFRTRANPKLRQVGALHRDGSYFGVR
jgi:hypothetical protein